MTTDPIYIGVVANLDDEGYSRRKTGDWSAYISRDRTELVERVAGLAYKYNKESGKTRYAAYVGTLTDEVSLRGVSSARWPKPAPPKPDPNTSAAISDDDIPF